MYVPELPRAEDCSLKAYYKLPTNYQQDNPLHISLFPPHTNSELEFTFMLNSCLDIFDIRQHNKTIDQDLGLLQAIDERLAMYGWLTTTGVKFVIIVDMAGRPAPQDGERGKLPPIVGLRDSDLKPVRLLSAARPVAY
jgi:hypothetical protein